MAFNLEKIAALLLIAALVAIAARRLRLPYTVGLVLAGLGISYFALPLNIHLTQQLIYEIFLPPLLFEAAFILPWRGLRANAPLIAVLATLGVLMAAAIVTVGMIYILGWPWQAALLFGVLISATDPVAVIATFKSIKVHERLSLLVESESLFNDGMAAVLFALALAAVSSGVLPSVTEGILIFLTTIIGGVAAGLIVGGMILLLARRTDDHLVEITFTVIAAYGAFLLAEHFHCSGVLATLTAGILIGNGEDFGRTSAYSREAVLSFWEYASFVMNSLIFLLIGMPLSQHDFMSVLTPLAVAILLALTGRAAAIYLGCGIFSFSEKLRVPSAHQHVLFWGGLRGALALALVLGVPPELPYHNLLVTIAFGVVAFSIIVQGVTITPLLRYLGEDKA